MEASVRLAPTPDECCARCTRYARWLRGVADSLGLRDWAVTFEHDPPAVPAALATVEVGEGFRHARIRVLDDFWDLDPGEQRYVLLHEVFHVILHELHETVRRGAGGEFGGAALRIFMGQVDHEAERAVDVLARAFAPFAPYPAPAEG